MSDAPLSPALFELLAEAKLPMAARAVFLFIYARAHGQVTPDGSPWGAPLSLSQIARGAGCSKSTAKRMIPLLESAGLVEVRYKRERTKAIYFLGPAICIKQ